MCALNALARCGANGPADAEPCHADRHACNAQRILHPARAADNGSPRTGQQMAPRAALAQLVEHIIRNDGVTCSSHVSGTTSSTRQIAISQLRGLSAWGDQLASSNDGDWGALLIVRIKVSEYAAYGPVVDWQMLAARWLKRHVGLQLAAAGHPMAATGWEAE